MYVLVNKAGQKLSGFYPNAGSMRLMLAYRKGDYYTYGTIDEAMRHLEAIHEYGIGKTLQIVER